MKRTSLGKKFTLENNSLTIRYKSQTFTTSTFKKEILNYVLTCQFLLEKFNTEFFKECYAALVYIDVRGETYMARVGGFAAIINPETVTLNIALVNIQPKEAFDMEHMTPAAFYKEFLEDKKFFKQEGKSLDLLVSPLGISRKPRESDQALRRRVISYLQSQVGNQSLQEKIKEMIRQDEGDFSNE